MIERVEIIRARKFPGLIIAEVIPNKRRGIPNEVNSRSRNSITIVEGSVFFRIIVKRMLIDIVTIKEEFNKFVVSGNRETAGQFIQVHGGIQVKVTQNDNRKAFGLRFCDLRDSELG